jgi:RNA polymerase primary sigma factor
MPMMTGRFETVPLRPRLPRRPGGLAGGGGKALAILTGWQQAGFRGYAIAENRADRRLVVTALATMLSAEKLMVSCLLIAADDAAREQWHRYLSDDTSALPDGWSVQTPEAALAHGGRLDLNCVVIADEFEVYLTEDFAAAIAGARAILGLCASPNGFQDAAPLRKYLGRALDLGHADEALDLSSLVEHPPASTAVESEYDADTREQLLTVSDPEDLLGYYLTQTQKVPLLTAEEEIVLSKQIEAGVLAEALLADRVDPVWPTMSTWRMTSWWRSMRPSSDELQELVNQGRAAKERFLVANLRLVYSVARRFSRRMELMDAIQEGNMGLIRAVEKFDHTKGYKFSTYATWWIRQAIGRAVADQPYLIRLPVHIHEADSPVLDELRRRKREDESISATDIAAALRMDRDEVEAILLRHRRPDSLEAMCEADIDIGDPFAEMAYDNLALPPLQDQLKAVLDRLSEREAGVISMRFGLTDGEEHTLDEIGKVYGLTRERIRQIESKAMTKMRDRSRSAVLIDYFDGKVDPDFGEVSG